jgi:hypothetical protein
MEPLRSEDLTAANGGSMRLGVQAANGRSQTARSVRLTDIESYVGVLLVAACLGQPTRCPGFSRRAAPDD